MNANAFFSSILVFSFSFFLLSFLSSNTGLQNKLNSSIQSCLELEKSSFERSILEQETDIIVEKIIERQALARQLSSLEVSSAVNHSLTEYFKHSAARNNFLFFEKEFEFGNNYSKLSENPAIPFFALTDEFKANVVRLQEHLFLVEVSYAGGASGKKLVFALTGYGSQKQFFLVPFNYSVKKLVVS